MNGSPYGAKLEADRPGLAPKLLEFCEELRRRGRRGRDLGDPRRLRGAGAGALDGPRRLPRGAGGDDRQVAGGPARLRAALRPLLLPRRRGRGGRARRSARASSATRAASGSTSTSCASAVRQAIVDGNDGEMRDLARLAIAAFGRRGEGSGVIGVDVQRIRRTLGLTAGTQPPDEDGEAPQIDREQLNRFERHLRRELERALIERTETLPPSRPLAELDRALPTSPAQDLAAVHRAVAQMKRRLATLGHEQRGRRRGRGGRRAADDARLAGDRRGAAAPALPAQAPAPARRSTSSATSRPRSPRPASSSSPSCTRCTTRSASCAASSSSSGSPR